MEILELSGCISDTLQADKDADEYVVGFIKDGPWQVLLRHILQLNKTDKCLLALGTELILLVLNTSLSYCSRQFDLAIQKIGNDFSAKLAVHFFE